MPSGLQPYFVTKQRLPFPEKIRLLTQSLVFGSILVLYDAHE